MNEYRGKHAPSQPWPVASTAAVRSGKGRHRKKDKRKHIRLFFLILLLLVIIAYPFLEARILLTEKTVLVMDDLPSDANHLRVVFLSDIHWGFWFSNADLDGLISRINNLRPDLVLFGGDYATDYASAVRFFQQMKKTNRIHARYGIYGVVGDSDLWESSYEQSQLLEAMSGADVIPLVNKTASINIGTGRIIIAGAYRPAKGAPDIKSLAGSLSPSDFVIFLAHDPSLINTVQQTSNSSGELGWLDLGLFGHTHGGQMAFFSDLLDIAPEVPDRYRSGWLTENRGTLLISRGIGTSVVPCRLFCYPQIHCIELTTN
jgi:predicted MPP superfamily phosphohydrolase